MTSLKCPQCSFTNFSTAATCKKCNASLRETNGARSRLMRPKAEIPADAFVCTSCGILCKPEIKSKGTALVDGIFLLLAIITFFLNWIIALVFLVVSLGYMAWRLSGGAQVCPGCGHPNPIPVATPVAQQLLASLQK